MHAFYKRILGVGQNSYENAGICDLAGIRINDVGRIYRPVNFDLFAGFPLDMHSCSALFLILLDVIAELGIHDMSGSSPFKRNSSQYSTRGAFIDSVP